MSDTFSQMKKYGYAPWLIELSNGVAAMHMLSQAVLLRAVFFSRISWRDNILAFAKHWFRMARIICSLSAPLAVDLT